jgi:hypothetical protein
MLSLPLLAHPTKNADESPAATTIRHAITPPNAVAAWELLLAALRTGQRQPLPERPFTPRAKDHLRTNTRMGLSQTD